MGTYIPHMQPSGGPAMNSANIVTVTAEQYARLTCDDDKPKSCPCECHKPKHEAQQPHANCMIGRK